MKVLTLIVTLIASISAMASPWEMDSVKQSLQGRVLDEVEGIWQFPEDGARLLIRRASQSEFDIIVLDSPQLQLKPGTSIGRAVITAKKRTYDAKLHQRAIGNKHIKNSTVLLTVTDEGMLRFSPYNENIGVKISASNTLRNILPMLLRINITKGKRPEGLIGAQRIYPPNKDSFKPCF